jgi:hypothetical protein
MRPHELRSRDDLVSTAVETANRFWKAATSGEMQMAARLCAPGCRVFGRSIDSGGWPDVGRAFAGATVRDEPPNVLMAADLESIAVERRSEILEGAIEDCEVLVFTTLLFEEEGGVCAFSVASLVDARGRSPTIQRILSPAKLVAFAQGSDSPG